MTPLEALQRCLAAEHATTYGYGVIGGRLAVLGAGTPTDTLTAGAYADHRALRDELTDVVRGFDAEPVAAEASYDTPFLVDDLDDCRRLARLLEERCAAVYADAVATSLDETRETLALALRGAAIRRTRWGARVEAFPGLAGR